MNRAQAFQYRPPPSSFMRLLCFQQRGRVVPAKTSRLPSSFQALFDLFSLHQAGMSGAGYHSHLVHLARQPLVFHHSHKQAFLSRVPVAHTERSHSVRSIHCPWFGLHGDDVCVQAIAHLSCGQHANRNSLATHHRLFALYWIIPGRGVTHCRYTLKDERPIGTAADSRVLSEVFHDVYITC